jgi:hypothetical protein
LAALADGARGCSRHRHVARLARPRTRGSLGICASVSTGSPTGRQPAQVMAVTVLVGNVGGSSHLASFGRALEQTKDAAAARRPAPRHLCRMHDRTRPRGARRHIPRSERAERLFGSRPGLR